ncbi:MAG: regulatory protein TetR [Solirubrobacterales bacterium]|nr:regulatory protein TetR [Solirubrobacterales bacterium]
MIIPPPVAWAELDAAAKRARLLEAARELFAREGLGAAMPAVAAAAGAGVGSVYRQFADKDDLVAALVLQRLAEILDEIDGTSPTAEPFGDVAGMVWRVIETGDGCDDMMTEAIAATSDRPDVSDARADVAAGIERLLDRARVEGTLRPDAVVQDVRLLFAAVRGADRVAPGGGRRIAELLLDGLRAR